MKDIALTNAHLGIHLQAEAFDGRFNYPEGIGDNVPFWKQVLATATLQGGEVLFCEPFVQGEWGFRTWLPKLGSILKRIPPFR